jgi:hypothetical protein
MLVLVGWDLLPYPIFEFISGPSDQNSDQSGPKWNAWGHFNIRARTDPMIWIQTQRLGYFRRSELPHSYNPQRLPPFSLSIEFSLGFCTSLHRWRPLSPLLPSRASQRLKLRHSLTLSAATMCAMPTSRRRAPWPTPSVHPSGREVWIR